MSEPAATEGDIVLEVRNLHTDLWTRRGVVHPVDGVSFEVRKGETLGIVGESGCGKTLTGMSVLRLLPPAARIVDGEVLLNGRDLLMLSDEEMRLVRGRQISMIPQDPHTSLDPVLNVGQQVVEALHQREGAARRNLWREAVESLKLLRIPAPEQRASNYPHQLSGGMKQRVVGAIAMSCRPAVIIADEPTTALDVTIQAQYLRLLRELQRTAGVALLFITHDFGVVARMCDRAMVMYAGRVVEQGPVRTLFKSPAHPYTQALLASVPTLTDSKSRLRSIEGQPPELHSLPRGCRFAPRCPHVMERCRRESPAVVAVGPNHSAECFLLEA